MISTSNGWRSRRSVDRGLRPRASEISLPAPTNLPLGDVQVSSGSSFELIFFTAADLGFERGRVNGVWREGDPDWRVASGEGCFEILKRKDEYFRQYKRMYPQRLPLEIAAKIAG